MSNQAIVIKEKTANTLKTNESIDSFITVTNLQSSLMENSKLFSCNRCVKNGDKGGKLSAEDTGQSRWLFFLDFFLAALRSSFPLLVAVLLVLLLCEPFLLAVTTAEVVAVDVASLVVPFVIVVVVVLVAEASAPAWCSSPLPVVL